MAMRIFLMLVLQHGIILSATLIELKIYVQEIGLKWEVN